MKKGIIIQARTGSTRLANKIMLDFWEGRTILSLLMERLKRDNPMVTIVLATTTRPADDCLEAAAIKAGVEVYRGSEEDVLARFIGAAEAFSLEVIVRVCSDNPFLQTAAIDMLFIQYERESAEYISWGFPSGLPTIKSHLGLFTELTTLTALRRVAELTQESLYREHVTNYLYAHPETFRICLLELPAYLRQREDLRFTVDTAADFEAMQQLYAEWEREGRGSIKRVIERIDRESAIGEGMRERILMNSK